MPVSSPFVSVPKTLRGPEVVHRANHSSEAWNGLGTHKRFETDTNGLERTQTGRLFGGEEFRNERMFWKQLYEANRYGFGDAGMGVGGVILKVNACSTTCRTLRVPILADVNRM